MSTDTSIPKLAEMSAHMPLSCKGCYRYLRIHKYVPTPYASGSRARRGETFPKLHVLWETHPYVDSSGKPGTQKYAAFVAAQKKIIALAQNGVTVDTSEIDTYGNDALDMLIAPPSVLAVI